MDHIETGGVLTASSNTLAIPRASIVRSHRAVSIRAGIIYGQFDNVFWRT